MEYYTLLRYVNELRVFIKAKVLPKIYVILFDVLKIYLCK